MHKSLTLKQNRFVKKFIENGGNGTQAAMAVYDVKNYNTAHAISSENLQKPTIREAIEEALRSKGLTINQLVGNLGEIANARPNKISGDTALKANIEPLKLLDAYPNKSYQYSYSVRQNLSSLPMSEFKKKTEEIDNELKKIIGYPIATQNG